MKSLHPDTKNNVVDPFYFDTDPDPQIRPEKNRSNSWINDLDPIPNLTYLIYNATKKCCFLGQKGMTIKEKIIMKMIENHYENDRK